MTGRTVLSAVVAGVVAAGVAATPAAGAGGPPPVKPRQDLVSLLEPHRALAKPDSGSRRVARVPATRPITGVQTVLPVLRRASRRGRRWLQVRLPGRPNGSKGWIARRATVMSDTGWHIVVLTARRRVVVHRDGRRVRSFSAIVGAPSTPTPHGPFFVEESVAMVPGSAGTPFALALSARSNVLQEFAGGPGQTAIHGLGNVGGTLGTAVSHGCIRLGDRSIRWLAARIGPGVPVTIR